jgi:integrase
MAGVRERRLMGGLCQVIYIDWRGRQKSFKGTKSERKTLQVARKLEAEDRLVRLGYKPPPTAAIRQRNRPFREVMNEYLAWGRSQGGRGGRPWSATHSGRREFHLDWWERKLKLSVLGDLDRGDLMVRMEKALRAVLAKGAAGKTVQHYADGMHGFCLWLEKRNYLERDPLKNMRRFDTTPTFSRRALALAEMGRLLTVASPQRRLVYEMAMCSGLRANELRSLRVSHLDVARGGLNLDANWTKARKTGFQPLASGLVARLAEANTGRNADAPLLAMPDSGHTARELRKDLEAAKIAEETLAGRVDFHALRNTYATLVFDAGGTVKEAMSMVRHTTSNFTLNLYARTRDERLAHVAERVGDMVVSSQTGGEAVVRLAAGAERQAATNDGANVYAYDKVVEAGGIEPGEKAVRRSNTTATQLNTNRTKPQQRRASAQDGHHAPKTQSTHRLDAPDTPKTQDFCVQDVFASLPQDLHGVVSAWATLPDAVKAGIVAMVKASKGGKL